MEFSDIEALKAMMGDRPDAAQLVDSNLVQSYANKFSHANQGEPEDYYAYDPYSEGNDSLYDSQEEGGIQVNHLYH